MRTHVALLRAINLAGRYRAAMADLRQVASCLGHTDVATYIQSGNLVFTTTQTDTGQAVFRRQDLTPAETAAVAAAQQRARDKGSRDEATVARRTLFLYTPDGLGRSELATQLARSSTVMGAMGSGPAGTARNWATVTAGKTFFWPNDPWLTCSRPLRRAG